MAMIRCTECRKDVSDKAATCPNCGAPVDVKAAREIQSKKNNLIAKVILVAVFALVALKVCTPSRSPDTSTPSAVAASAPPVATNPQKPSQETLKYWMTDLLDEKAPAARRESYAHNVIQNFPDTPEAAKANELLPAITAKAANEKTNGRWVYSADEDPMSGKTSYTAYVKSENTLNLDFPYQGEQQGTLVIRRSPRHGNDVFVTIEKGQIMCSDYSCPVRFRFDDAAPVTYTGNEPADNSAETVFVPYSIAKKIQSAKRVRVEFNLFHNGVGMLEFNVKGLDPDQLKAQ